MRFTHRVMKAYNIDQGRFFLAFKYSTGIRSKSELLTNFIFLREKKYCLNFMLTQEKEKSPYTPRIYKFSKSSHHFIDFQSSKC